MRDHFFFLAFVFFYRNFFLPHVNQFTNELLPVEHHHFFVAIVGELAAAAAVADR